MTAVIGNAGARRYAGPRCPLMHPQTVTFHKVAPTAPGPAIQPVPTSPGETASRGSRLRKPFVKRRGDRSPDIPFPAPLFFATIALWVGIQFVMWVRYFESGGTAIRVERPDGVEAWLPIASLMNLKALTLRVRVPDMHVPGLFMLIAFLAISLVFRKAFCSWICPVGTISEWLWQTGRTMFKRALTPPRWLHIGLRSLKYVLLSLFIYVVVAMPVPEIRAFLGGDYGLVADVKMLNFFRHMGQGTAMFLMVLAALSLGVRNAWCRCRCPYGALMGVVALVSPTRIVRNADACIDCAKCAKACPAGLPVDVLASVKSAECTACMSCVAVCPAAGALDLAFEVSQRRHA